MPSFQKIQPLINQFIISKNMISQIGIANVNGDLLIYYDFKGDIFKSEVEYYCRNIIAKKQNSNCPFFMLDSSSFINIIHRQIVIFATTKININCAMVLQYLYSFLNLIKKLISNEVNQNIISRNQTSIYELLYQSIDYGCPQTTDEQTIRKQSILSMPFYMYQKPFRGGCCFCNSSQNLIWRKQNIQYKRNQIYVDIFESSSYVISANRNILRAQASGKIYIKPMLSYFPDCSLGLNKKHFDWQKQSKQYHKCIKVNHLQSNQHNKDQLTFMPPDLEFTLVSYKSSTNISLPLELFPIYDFQDKSKLIIKIKLKSLFDTGAFGQDLKIRIPVPQQAFKVNCSSLLGKMKYIKKQYVVQWTISKLQANVSVIFNCQVLLDWTKQNIQTKWKKPSIKLSLQIRNWVASGLKINYVRIYAKQGYKSYKMIRYRTKVNEYQQRLQ